MDIVDRGNKIISLLGAVGGTIRGRKKLQKLVYLLQFKGEDFDQDYSYWHFGVYSKTLASDLSYLVASGILLEERTQEEGFESYVIRLAPESDADSYDALASGDLAKTLSAEKPRTLELLSTIVYLSARGLAGDELMEELRKRKEHLFSELAAASEIAQSKFSVAVTVN